MLEECVCENDKHTVYTSVSQSVRQLYLCAKWDLCFSSYKEPNSQPTASTSTAYLKSSIQFLFNELTLRKSSRSSRNKHNSLWKNWPKNMACIYADEKWKYVRMMICTKIVFYFSETYSFSVFEEKSKTSLQTLKLAYLFPFLGKHV